MKYKYFLNSSAGGPQAAICERNKQAKERVRKEFNKLTDVKVNCIETRQENLSTSASLYPSIIHSPKQTAVIVLLD